MQLDEMTDAAVVYRGLIRRNPENRNYYLQLEKALNLTKEEDILQFYREYKAK